MKRLLAVILGLSLIGGVGLAADVTYYKDIDGDGYFTGTFYKDASTNEVYKVISETDDTIYLGYVDEGVMHTNK